MEFIVMKKNILGLILFLGSPLTLIASIWLKFVKQRGIGKISDKIFMKIGLLPLIDNYYEPLINPKKYLTTSLRKDRKLNGINFNIEEQIGLFSNFNFNNELLQFPIEKKEELEFYHNNGSYAFADAEYLYNIIRHFKPKRIIEIGSGNSTLMACNAIKANKIQDDNYSCYHICIEPFEQPWLEKLGIDVIREKVETLSYDLFEQLEKNDILFIDSSHIIRPEGDVLFEYLEILPLLKPGVIVHIHDIFTPKNYLDNWVINEHRLWNEQYILEAFLTLNTEFRIIGALNYLHHNYKNESDSCHPISAKNVGHEPGAFWIIRN
jgi:predicted O-methyltransferase YrrM